MYESSIVAANVEIEVGHPQQLATGVFLIRLPLPFALDHINVYLLEDSDGWILVDTGLFTPQSTEILKRVIDDEICVDKPLKAVLVTHAHVDHSGAAGWICEHWNVPLWMTQREHHSVSTFLDSARSKAPESETELRRFFVRGGIESSLINQMITVYKGFGRLFSPIPSLDSALDSEQVLTINGNHWRLFVSDGHTLAHLSLYCEDLSVLIGGDQVLGRISSNVSVRPDHDSGNPIASWIEGLSALKCLPKDTLVLPSHEQPFYGLHFRLDELISGYVESADKLHRFSYTDNTAEELMRALYPRELSPFEVHLAFGETQAYINYLLADGRLEVINPGSSVPLYQRLGG